MSSELNIIAQLRDILATSALSTESIAMRLPAYLVMLSTPRSRHTCTRRTIVAKKCIVAFVNDQVLFLFAELYRLILSYRDWKGKSENGRGDEDGYRNVEKQQGGPVDAVEAKERLDIISTIR